MKNFKYLFCLLVTFALCDINTSTAQCSGATNVGTGNHCLVVVRDELRIADTATYVIPQGLINAAVPTQSGNADKFLKTNGKVVSWGTPPTNAISTTTVYASGTVYALTTTSQKIDFGTTDPTITLNASGTYVIWVNVRLGYNGLVSLGNRTATIKLRRTNNTAADLSNGITNFITPVASIALTTSAGDCDVPVIVYTTSNSNDVIELWGSLSAGVTGSVEVQEASIVALKIL